MTDFSYQLYSSRNFQPWSETYKLLSSLGYKGVEAFSDLVIGADPSAFLSELEVHGLSMKTCHFGIDLIDDDIDQAVDLAKQFKLERIYVPYLVEEQRPTDAAGWTKLGQKLSEMGKPFRDAGFGFGWHNHDFEFTKLATGELPMELILDAADDLELEFDVAWAVRAGYEPTEFIKKYGSRITSVHVKDIAPEGECVDEDGWSDVGNGIVDWPNYLQQTKDAGAKIFIMEHDNPNDHVRFAKTSIENARKL